MVYIICYKKEIKSCGILSKYEKPAKKVISVLLDMYVYYIMMNKPQIW